MDFERELGIPSAFYVGTWNRWEAQSQMTDRVATLATITRIRV